ncbi:Fic family protein [Actinospica acidithermotolerans]|nr:Fic family protein [Actinospica acidithermotolerans]
MPQDHLLTWREVREHVPWADAVRHGLDRPDAPVQPGRDGVAHRIATVERERDPARARRLLAAYEKARAAAEAREQLDFPLLASWQRTVLGVAEAPFRDRPAFAKGGRERYGLGPGTQAAFEACLAEARDDAVPLAARAARAYLDVCFFHPFADGNGRAALLTLAYVLAAEDVVLDQVGPIAQISRRADDAEGAATFADLVALMIERAARSGSATSRRTGAHSPVPKVHAMARRSGGHGAVGC